MTHNRNDFKIRRNRQTHRSQTDLWDVTIGGERFTTAQSEAEAQRLADCLNKDSWYMERGQTRADRCAPNHVQRDN